VVSHGDRAGLRVAPHAALLVVDVQRGFMTAETASVPARIAAFLDRYEHAFELIVASRYRNTASSPCRRILAYEGMAGPPDTDLCDGIERETVRIRDKETYAIGPALTRMVATQRIQVLYLVGLDTHACVLHEALDAFDRGIRPLVLHDLCASGDGADAHRAALHVLRQSIGVQNVVDSTGTPFRP
jgi:nicotinamidase-related amidase